MTILIGPEGRVDDLDIFLGDKFWVIVVFWVEAFFESVIHSIDGGFAIVVTFEGVEIGFLDEKEQK